MLKKTNQFPLDYVTHTARFYADHYNQLTGAHSASCSCCVNFLYSTRSCDDYVQTCGWFYVTTMVIYVTLE